MPDTIESLTSLIEREIQEYDENNSWHIVYGRMKNRASLEHLNCSVKEARLPENRCRNRYRDVHPYDHSRIVLDSETNYINANLAEVPSVNARYILTQGPLEHTICDFWQMVWQQNCKAVLMLNRVIEKGSVKCSQYWPKDGGSDVYGDEFRVTVVDECDHDYFILRTLILENLQTQSSRDILHFHYVMWPDFGVPESPKDFLDFLLSVRLSGSLDCRVGPAVIHCSAGIGRTGTFCLVDSCLLKIAKSHDQDSVNVLETLIELRSYRMGLIQTPDQLRFSYIAILDGARRLFSSDDPFSALLRNNNNVLDTGTDISETENSTSYCTEDTIVTDTNSLHNINDINDSSVLDNNMALLNDNKRDIRRRNREEMNKKTKEQIERMKQRRHECSWFHERWWRPYINFTTITMGVSVMAAVIGGFMYYSTNYVS